MQGFFNRQSPYNNYLVDGYRNCYDQLGNRCIKYTYPIQRVEVEKIQDNNENAVKEIIKDEIESREIEKEYEPKVQGGKVRVKPKFSFANNNVRRVPIRGKFN